MADLNVKLLKRQQLRAHKLQANFLECRLLGHSWGINDQADTRAENGEGIGFVCERCGCLRLDIIGRRYGELIKRRYTHPTDYLVAKDDSGDRAFSAAALRTELLSRLTAPKS